MELPARIRVRFISTVRPYTLQSLLVNGVTAMSAALFSGTADTCYPVQRETLCRDSEARHFRAASHARQNQSQWSRLSFR